MSRRVRPSVTLVGHDASRTGAPIVLESFLRWLDRSGSADTRVLLLRGGPLLEQYRRTAPTRVLSSPLSRNAGRLSSAGRAIGADVLAPDPTLRFQLRNERRSDIVVANTFAALEVASALAGGRRRVRSRLVCHVHELDGVASRVLPADRVQRQFLLDGVDHFAATGHAVGRMLRERLGVAASRITVIDGFIEAPAVSDTRRRVVRDELADRTNRPLVLAVGAMSRRKGPERFVDLMSTLAHHPRRPIGVWIGGDDREVVWIETLSDVERSGVAGSVKLLPELANTVHHLAAADVVVSTAIEDPFPLVVLEAAALGVPVVGFDSGGLEDVLLACEQGDAVRPVGDVLGMRDVVGRLLDDEALRRDRGRQLSEWVHSTHLVDHLAPRLWDVISG